MLYLTHQNTLFYTIYDLIHAPQISKSTKKGFKKGIFGQISNSSLIFYHLPILGLSFKFYYSSYPVII